MPRYVVVVSARNRDLYELLLEQVEAEHDPNVDVVLDRRVGDRRKEDRPVARERRVGERRTRPDVDARLRTASVVLVIRD